eukprot:201986-Pelagomonas_calceolata.AAC.1
MPYPSAMYELKDFEGGLKRYSATLRVAACHNCVITTAPAAMATADNNDYELERERRIAENRRMLQVSKGYIDGRLRNRCTSQRAV